MPFQISSGMVEKVLSKGEGEGAMAFKSICYAEFLTPQNNSSNVINTGQTFADTHFLIKWSCAFGMQCKSSFVNPFDGL